MGYDDIINRNMLLTFRGGYCFLLHGNRKTFFLFLTKKTATANRFETPITTILYARTAMLNLLNCSLCPMPPHVLVDFVVLPPGHGSSVTDFRGWDAHKAQLRCADDVTGDIGGRSARRALKPKFY